jgi:hypothetical protein
LVPALSTCQFKPASFILLFQDAFRQRAATNISQAHHQYLHNSFSKFPAKLAQG